MGKSGVRRGEEMVVDLQTFRAPSKIRAPKSFDAASGMWHSAQFALRLFGG